MNKLHQPILITQTDELTDRSTAQLVIFIYSIQDLNPLRFRGANHFETLSNFLFIAVR